MFFLYHEDIIWHDGAWNCRPESAGKRRDTNIVKYVPISVRIHTGHIVSV